MSEKKQQTSLQLDGLFGHLSCSDGLYARDTFINLFSCIARMIRDHHLEGFAIARTLGDDGFDTATLALDNLQKLKLIRVDETLEENPVAQVPNQLGFLLVLTNRLCAALYWSPETNETFSMYEGGWTFHPNDTKTITERLVELLDDAALKTLLDETAIDRRYDDKLNVITTSLVNGLETRNRKLVVALDQVNVLNNKVLQSERLAAIGQLSSVIAHEIRNPLGLIDLYAKLIEAQVEQLTTEDEERTVEEKTEQTDKLKKNLDQVRQATQSLETILSELTNYAKPLTLNQETVDLVSFARDIGEFYQPKYDEKGVALVLPDGGEKPVTICASIDRDRIRQSLINLLKNALEASPPDTKVVLSVDSRQHDPNVFIKVKDQGCGIDDIGRKKLFTPYFSTKQKGTGLGLAHCRKILQAHGGNVECLHSMPGEGSVFAMILPVLLNPEEPLVDVMTSGVRNKPQKKSSKSVQKALR